MLVGSWWAAVGSMLPQRGQLPSIEKREAETQCLQCQDVTAHTFMGCQTSSQGQTVPFSNSLSVHLQPPVHDSDQQCLPSTIFQSQGLPKASLHPTIPKKPRASGSLDGVCAYVYL